MLNTCTLFFFSALQSMYNYLSFCEGRRINYSYEQSQGYSQQFRYYCHLYFPEENAFNREKLVEKTLMICLALTPESTIGFYEDHLKKEIFSLSKSLPRWIFFATWEELCPSYSKYETQVKEELIILREILYQNLERQSIGPIFSDSGLPCPEESCFLKYYQYQYNRLPHPFLVKKEKEVKLKFVKFKKIYFDVIDPRVYKTSIPESESMLEKRLIEEKN